VLLDDRDAEVIRAKIVASHFDDACGQLLIRVVELLTLGPVMHDNIRVTRETTGPPATDSFDSVARIWQAGPAPGGRSSVCRRTASTCWLKSG
jgi:hypothetical protein